MTNKLLSTIKDLIASYYVYIK